MFNKSFNPEEALKAVKCPRCNVTGLKVIDYVTFEAAPVADRHQATCTIDPSQPVRCPACGLVLEWPGGVE